MPYFRRDGHPVVTTQAFLDFFGDHLAPWCRYLESLVGISPQHYADNLQCFSYHVDSVLAADQSILYPMFMLWDRRPLQASVYYLAPLKLLVDA